MDLRRNDRWSRLCSEQPEMGLTVEAIKRRIAKGAKVSVMSLTDNGKNDVMSY